MGTAHSTLRTRIKMKAHFFLLILSVITYPVFAGEADVVDLKVRYNGNDSFQVITTVKHLDSGWDHYANGWEVLDEKGNVLGKRVLHHPHVNEQPFTRSHTLTIPISVKKITVRAIDSVHGVGGKERTIVLSRDK